jgi:hypothetical protein
MTDALRGGFIVPVVFDGEGNGHMHTRYLVEISLSLTFSPCQL